MTTNPLFNALAASGYIVGLVLFIFNFVAQPEKEDSILIPMAMLSLFVLSAAVMGYLFLSQPLQLWFDGKRPEAVKFFLTTTAGFAGLTGLIFFILIYTLQG